MAFFDYCYECHSESDEQCIQCLHRDNKRLRDEIKRVLSKDFVSEFGWSGSKVPLAHYSSPMHLLLAFCEYAKQAIEGSEE